MNRFSLAVWVSALSMLGGIAPALSASAASMENPTLQWGDSKRPDGTTRHWNPAPLIDLKATLVCVAYRPLTEKGERWYAVGMTPPKVLAKALLNTRPELDECHRHGIKVIGYADSIMFHSDMLAADGIDSGNLHAIDRRGQRVVNNVWDKAGADLSCILNPRWLELQKEVARVTAAAGFDGLQFDVYPYAIDPGYLCCCPHCQEAWRRESAKVFGAAQPMPGLDSGKLDFRKPVDRAFKTWRLQKFVEFVKAVETSVQRSYPKFIIIMNHGGGTPDFTYEAINGALKHPSTELWHLALGDVSSLYLYSSAEASGIGKLIGLINGPDQMRPSYRYRVALAEAYAAGGTFYAVAGTGEDGSVLKISRSYCDFFRQHQEWFNETESAAAVAVLYSWRDQAFKQGNPVAEAKVEFDPQRNHYQKTAGMLARMGVPNDCLIVEKGLSVRGLSRYKVIVAPELSLVSDKDAATLKKYVSAGGRLLVIGDMGSVAESGQEWRKRDQSLLTQWAGGSISASLGKGIIASTPRATNTTRLSPEFRAAGETVQLTSQVRIESGTPMESTVRARDLTRAIHLIRFGPTDSLTNRAVSVNFQLPIGYGVKEVSVLSPDFAAAEMSFTWKNVGDRVQVSIDRVDTYALVGLMLQPVKSRHSGRFVEK
jgi:hypothetical protein